MIGRETWKTANKLLPGVYIRLISANRVLEDQSESATVDYLLLTDSNGVFLRTYDGYYLAVIPN